jgi:hypothetical protein
VLHGNVRISPSACVRATAECCAARDGASVAMRAWRHDMSLAGSGEDIAAAYFSDDEDEVTRLV